MIRASETFLSFVVDTDSYAGNFEREMCAFVTGKFDDYGEPRGGPYRDMFVKDGGDALLDEDLVEFRFHEHDDSGWLSPVSLEETPGFENDGEGNHRRIPANVKPKYPANNSVAIRLSRQPTDKEVGVLVERAKAFSRLPKIKDWDHRPQILGFRILEELRTYSSRNVG